VQPVNVSQRRAQSHEPSIAVLPFEDLSRERDQGYFADGIAEEVLNRLAEIKGLRVIAKSSAFAFRERLEGAQAIGRALGVDYLLMGAVRKDGEQLRVTARLVDASSDSQRWSARFDRELEHVFAIQDDIARAVANALRATLGVGERAALPGGTSNLVAYDAYLRARAVQHQSGGQAMIRAAELYRDALALDPSFALAWVGLAEASRGMLIFAPERAEQGMRDLDEAANQAVSLAPDLWASHMAASWRYVLERDWPGLEHALARARELMPGSPPPQYHFYVGAFFATIGQMAAAVEHFQWAARDDPLSLLTSSLLQVQLHVAGNEPAAEAEYQRSLDLPGNRDIAENVALHRAWAREAAARDVQAQFRRYLDNATITMPVLHAVFEVFDQPEAALALLHSAAAQPLYQVATRQFFIACWLAHYGDDGAALAALWKSHVELRGAQMNWLWLPVLAPVRQKRGFKELVRRVNLVDYWRATGKWADCSRPVGTSDFECI
jgi:TolB-like protein